MRVRAVFQPEEVHNHEHPDHPRGCAGLVLTCKEHLLHYYAKFGFVSEDVSHSTHGGAVWYQMRLTF